MSHTYDQEGLTLTENFEGVKLTAYQDVRGVWTIGYGHTGPDVHPGLTITLQQAQNLLRLDVLTAAGAVNHAVTYPIDQHQFDALVDFVYNEGEGNFRKSTLLRDVNAGNLAGAAAQFASWVSSGGRVFDGLVRRRTAERAEFLEAA